MKVAGANQWPYGDSNFLLKLRGKTGNILGFRFEALRLYILRYIANRNTSYAFA